MSESSSSAEVEFSDLCENNVRSIEALVLENGENLLNYRQCGDLSSKLSRTTPNIRELVLCCGTSVALFRPALESLYRYLCKAKVLVSQCAEEDWCAAAVFQCENENAFRETLLDVGFCYSAIYELAKSRSEGWNDSPEDLRQSAAFRPASGSDVDGDRQDLANGYTSMKGWESWMPWKVAQQRSLAKYLLTKMRYTVSEAQANTLDKYDAILWSKASEPLWTWGNSYYLGSGSDGGVCRTEWLGVRCAKKEFLSREYESLFLKEAGILAHLKHPSIISFVCCGSGQKKGDRFIAMELMEMSLLDLIEEQKQKDVHFAVPVAVDMMVQIARGMCYSHGRGVAHRDLKPQNVVVSRLSTPHLSDDLCVKLVDFGVSKIKVEAWKSSTMTAAGIGTTTYRAPEAHPMAKFSEGGREVNWLKADAFSFAMTCAHLLSLEVPFGGTILKDLYKEVTEDGRRPRVPDMYPRDLVTLLEDCWKTNPRLRPSFVEICARLETFRHRYLRGYTLASEGSQADCRVGDEYIKLMLEGESSNEWPLDDEAMDETLCLQVPILPCSRGHPLEHQPEPAARYTGCFCDMCLKDVHEDDYQTLDCGMEKLATYLELARGCMEAVRGMSSRKFNDEQCGYLTEKLEAVVQSAISFLEDSHAEAHRPYSFVDIARWAETLKLLLALAKQIESFVQGCCKEAWMPAAMTLANVADYVSSLGFNLELCRVALCKVHAATRSLTLDEVGKINRDEMEIVKRKASIDAESLLEKAILELNSSKAEDSNLAKYLLHRLVRVGPKPTSDDDSVLVKLFEWVTSGRKVEQLGRGASAKVYKVMWLGTPVAKKTFDGPENHDFLQEVIILSQLCHPNITSMFCCSMNKWSCSIIMELMDGNLHDLMQSRLEENGDSPPFPILEGVDIMLQVGEGVNYLHGKRIVHRDLKSTNILFKALEASDLEPGYVQAKVVDFGLSKTKESSTTYSNMTYNMGTFRWMAPEVINLVPGSQGGRGGRAKLPKHQFKCDIYSFAMVCFEILTGEVPFQCEGTPKDIKKKVLGGLRPRLPDYCPAMLKSVIEKCWSQEPTERPTIGDVCLQLKHLKHLLMTSKMFQGCYTLHMMEPFEVVYLNIQSLPRVNQVRVNVFSPFLKELLLVPNGAISIDGPQLYYMHEKLDVRRAVCANKLQSSEPSSSADASRNKKELQHITQLVHFMGKEFIEIKSTYTAMEEKRRATWDMLWAFFPPGERVVYLDKLTDKCVGGEVLWTNYEETQEGPMLFVKVTRRDSNSQTWSKYLFRKILHMPSNEGKKKTWNNYAHTVTVPAFQGDRAFCRLDIFPVRFEEDPKVTEGPSLNTMPEKTVPLQRLPSIEAMGSS